MPEVWSPGHCSRQAQRAPLQAALSCCEPLPPSEPPCWIPVAPEGRSTRGHGRSPSPQCLHPWLRTLLQMWGCMGSWRLEPPCPECPSPCLSPSHDLGEGHLHSSPGRATHGPHLGHVSTLHGGANLARLLPCFKPWAGGPTQPETRSCSPPVSSQSGLPATPGCQRSPGSWAALPPPTSAPPASLAPPSPRLASGSILSPRTPPCTLQEARLAQQAHY